MCLLCCKSSSFESKPVRKKLWELTEGWHCAVVGTCLSLSELRGMAKKLSLKTKPGFNVDYQLHAYFVKTASTHGKAAKMLHKAMDKRHAVAIKRTKDLKTVEELQKYWETAVEEGDIPGPYWALLTHPVATAFFCEQMFADIHMLSHLVGASNRADIRRVTTLEEAASDHQKELDRLREKKAKALEERDRQIAELRQSLKLRRTLDLRNATTFKPANGPSPDQRLREAEAEIEKLRAALEAHREKLAAAEHDAEASRRRILDLETANANLLAENQVIEAQFGEEDPARQATPAIDLKGQSVLYVGGRYQIAPTLRSLVQGWNGNFLYHDGGLERSMDELARSISKSDTVVFPVDCVSHSAVAKVKKLCEQSHKPYFPLRSSGVASFVSEMIRSQQPAGAAE